MVVLDPAGPSSTTTHDVTVAAVHQPIGFRHCSGVRGRTQRDLEAIVKPLGAVAPVAAREFSRAEQLVFRVPLVTQGDTPAVSAAAKPFRVARPRCTFAVVGDAGTVQVRCRWRLWHRGVFAGPHRQERPRHDR